MNTGGRAGGFFHCPQHFKKPDLAGFSSDNNICKSQNATSININQ